MSISKRLRKILLLLCAIFLVSDLGLVTQYDGAVLSVIAGALFLEEIPYIMIAVSSIQDAPGFAYPSCYVVFLALFGFMLVHSLRNRAYISSIFYSLRNKNIYRILVFALIVVAYGVVSSVLYSHFGGPEQSSRRPPILVAVLAVVMILSAFISSYKSFQSDENIRFVIIVSFIILAHVVIILCIQAIFGAAMISSRAGGVSIRSAAQLIVPTSLGIPRLTGTYLSPNAMAYVMSLLALVSLGFSLWIKNYSTAKISSVILVIMPIVIAYFTLSKAIVLFSCSLSMIYSIVSRKKLVFIFVSTIVLAISIFIVIKSGRVDLDKIHSLHSNASAYGGHERLHAWKDVIEHFKLRDWFFGIGLSHWPIFFSKYESFTLEDPHSWLFSVPGNYGVLGVSFYIMLFYLMVRMSILSYRNNVYPVYLFSMSIISLVYLKDLVTVPYVFSNSQITFLIWYIIFSVFFMYGKKMNNVDGISG